nr:MAG TPA: hypothetical protein [Caudoviricetes sp.]
MDTSTNSKSSERQSVKYSRSLRVEKRNVLNDEDFPSNNLCMIGSI